MKKITSLLSLLFLSFALLAQTNFYKLSIGAGAGGTLAFADLQKKTLGFAAYGSLDLQITPYITLGGELQKGELAGGDITFDANNRQFINSYKAAIGNLRVQLGEFLTSYQLRNNFLYNIRGLYAGAGVGIISNKISNVRYYGNNFYPGDDYSKEGLILLNLGINFYIPNQWGLTRYAINLNLQNTMALGEGMDGYESVGTKSKDMYSFFSLGFKYNFGALCPSNSCSNGCDSTRPSRLCSFPYSSDYLVVGFGNKKFLTIGHQKTASVVIGLYIADDKESYLPEKLKKKRYLK